MDKDNLLNITTKLLKFVVNHDNISLLPDAFQNNLTVHGHLADLAYNQLGMEQLDYGHYLADKQWLTVLFCVCLTSASVGGILGNVLASCLKISLLFVKMYDLSLSVHYCKYFVLCRSLCRY